MLAAQMFRRTCAIARSGTPIMRPHVGGQVRQRGCAPGRPRAVDSGRWNRDSARSFGEAALPARLEACLNSSIMHAIDKHELPRRAACRICGHMGEVRPWGGIQCAECHSISAAHLPSASELAEFYSAFSGNYHGGGRARGAAARQVRYAQAYLRLIRTFCGGGAVLDVGSANNPLPNLLAGAGYDVAMTDFVRPDHLDDRVQFIGANLGDPTDCRTVLGEARYDLVSSFAVIEHVRDPREWAIMLGSLVRPRGHLILTTPEIGRFADRNALGRSRWFCPPEHLHLISREGMRMLFESAECALVLAGRLELNAVRWGARYGYVALAGLLGAGVRAVAPKVWRRARDQRVARGQGIASFVFRKGEAA